MNLRIDKNRIWDRLRKKYVLLTPEERVRQILINYLIEKLEYPEGLMSSEFTVEFNGMKKRCDVVIFDRSSKPLMIIECKAPEVSINENTFYQLARYVSVLKAPYLMMSNGKNNYCAKIEKSGLIYFEVVPTYPMLIG